MRIFFISILIGYLLSSCYDVKDNKSIKLSQDELTRLSAYEITEGIKSQEITATDLVSAIIQRAKKYDNLNAYITLDEKGSLNQAAKIDSQIKVGEKEGVLLGVPLIIKDNIEVMGLPNTAGTPSLLNYVPKQNASIVQELLKEGAIILGKANMHELAMGVTSINKHFGPVRNPYNSEYFAGGSSGGTATAVSYFLATAGLGSDTGGSVRIPSSFTGICGFRPSTGRYSQDGITPISKTRDTPGPMARSVKDLIMIDAAITHTDPVITPIEPHTIRLGVSRNHYYKGLDEKLEPIIDQALEKIENSGITLIYVDLPNMSFEWGRLLTSYEAVRDITEYLLLKTDGQIDMDSLLSGIASPDVKDILVNRFLGEGVIGLEEYNRICREDLQQFKKLFSDYFESNNLDAMIFPTTPVTARQIEGEAQEMIVNGKKVPTFATIAQNTQSGSLAGIPGITLPAGMSPDGLPIGIEIDGPSNSDQKLLRIALTLEKIMGGIPAPK